MSLQETTAVVTGASRGIGAAIARTLAGHGLSVAVADLTRGDDVVESIRETGGTARSYEVDISDPIAVQKILSAVEAEMGPVEVLVNNAGIIARGSMMDITHQQWQHVLTVNVTGTFNCCKAVLPTMIKLKKGSIINISSVAGKMGDVTAAPAYGTSKGALNALTMSLAREFAAYGIRVNAVAPHAIETDMSRQWSDDKRRSIIAGIPLGRLGTPDDVAEAVLYLASDRAAFITGEILDVNGGFLMD